MNNRMITATTLCVTLIATSFTHAEDKGATVVKKDTSLVKTAPVTAKNLSAADVMGDRNITIDATIAFVESFTIMGECQEGQHARQEIEHKRDLATQDIQEESKKFEKAKTDYMAKATMMSDAAREKEEKKLMKLEREIKTLVAEKEEELKLDMQAATELLAQGLEAGVAKLAKNENLDVVFDKMTGRAIYVSEKFDYTTKAIKEVDKNYEIKLAQNKQAETALKVADNKTAPKSAKAGA